MTLKEKIYQDMKNSMKEKNKSRLSVIRLIRASIINVEKDRKKDLNDEDIIEILSRELKIRKESINEYKKLNKMDIVKSLENEISIIQEYLPEQLGVEEIEKLVKNTINDLKVDNLKDIGKVMGVLMPKLKGRADGKLVKELVEKYL